MTLLRVTFCALVLPGLISSAATAADLPPAATRQIDFVKDVQPILRARCFECHVEGNEEGGLNLGVKARVLEGGENGPVLVPRKSAESRLIQLVGGVKEDAIMPPEGDRLTADKRIHLRGLTVHRYFFTQSAKMA